MGYYKYTGEEIKHLKERDPILGGEIDRIGMIQRDIELDIFSALISSIISQQISTEAAITVKGRLVDLIGTITAENIKEIELESIQNVVYL